MEVQDVAAAALQLLLPSTALTIAAKLLNHTLFSWHPSFISIGFFGMFGQGVLTSFAARDQQGSARVQMLAAHG